MHSNFYTRPFRNVGLLYFGHFCIRNFWYFKSFPFDSPVALEAVKKSYESQKKTFNECPLNEEDNLEMDKFVNITPSSNYLKESYQVTVKMNDE